MREYRTEAGEWQAIWRPERHRIRIELVRGIGGSDRTLVSSAPASDLADMRAELPELSALWDAIRREYWSRFPAQHEPPPHSPRKETDDL
ncbi:hypothetical protein [Nocardia veterana]|uniref:Uncharacterized protein n=1 Tax=Nocardia veterana TaxID=132249 RepID=A0A7X6M2D0_9NOCA|nr:hypothetical protein [Nocardia veterana]NKY88980.1 hypothetical protein [Nocardia veterana]